MGVSMWICPFCGLGVTDDPREALLRVTFPYYPTAWLEYGAHFVCLQGAMAPPEDDEDGPRLPDPADIA
jgi:hypothetical protein